MADQRRRFILLAWCSLLLLGVGCKKSVSVASPPEKAEVKDAVPDNLPQPADITGDVPQFLWSRDRQVNYDILTKKGISGGERFRKQVMAWNGKFESYEGRVLLTFEDGEEGPGGPLAEIAMLLWPAQEQKGQAAQPQRQALFAYWDKKLAARYGGDFKTSNTATTQSHTWSTPAGVEVEIRSLTDPAKPVQIGIYWTRQGASLEGDEEKEREREEAGEKK